MDEGQTSRRDRCGRIPRGQGVRQAYTPCDCGLETDSVEIPEGSISALHVDG